MAKMTLGLDLGTNSIGWALIEQLKDGSWRIIKLGSRIVPMDGAEMSNFKKGLPQTKNAQKRMKKGIRVGNKRYKQRRNKLIYVLQKLDMLPEQIRLSREFDDPLKIQKVNVLPVRKGETQYSAKEFMKLKVKAIHEPVSKQELGKILYRFNQLRGYAGGDDEDQQDELDNVLGIRSDKKFPAQENRIQTFKVLDYSSTEEIKKKKKVFNLKAVDSDQVEWSGTTLIENITIGDSLELKQTIRRNAKTGELTSTEFSIPKKTGWRKKMENLEEALYKYSKEKGRKIYLSEYFLAALNDHEWLRIRDNVILRSRYQEEFDAVWEKQYDTHFKNVSQETIKEIANFLFPGTKESQQKLRQEAIDRGLKHTIRDQIIYFQRPLKDQSHLISDCRFEAGEKAVANSHPLFQEYKIWEQINKLSINRRTQTGLKKDGKPRYKYRERNVSSTFKEFLFEELQEKEKLSFSTVFKKLQQIDDFEENQDFFNGLSSKSELIGNTTRATLKKRLGRFWNLLDLDKVENQIELWDLLYNGKGNEYDSDSDRNKALARYLKNKGIEKDKQFDKVVTAISCIKFPRHYQSISLKAVEKALPLVRAGKYFDHSNFPDEGHNRIIKLLNETTDDPYEKSVQNYLESNESLVLTEGGFINAHALMLLYGQHTAKEIGKKDVLNSYDEIKPLERHSLRNPLVEQMINETLMVVKDIWRIHGRPSEIKVELARELKNSKKERERMHEANEENRKENERVRKRLRELKEELSSGNVEKYKLWKGQRNTSSEYVKKYEATSEVEKMRLWEEQGHVDPYTGKSIPLSALFNKGLYDVDHIIPQSRYFDDSLGNKVVCATVVNKDKGNRTAMEYFDTGSIVCELLPKDEFMDNAVKKFFGNKRKHMLATKIPDNPVERQKKETQYISVRVREELAKMVGSNHVKTSSGGVTHYLRNHWRVTRVFKELLLERFTKYFELKAVKEFDKLSKEGDDAIFTYLDELAEANLPAKNKKELLKAYDKVEKPVSLEDFKKLYLQCHIYYKDNNLIIQGYTKRYDHRHHAMDALLVACTDEKAVKRLNDLNKHLQDWLEKNIDRFGIDLKDDDEDLLENFLQMEDRIRKKVLADIDKFRKIELPWNGFLKEAKTALEEIVVSHKPKDKLLIQYKEEKDEKGKFNKTAEKTIRIRGALHEETIYGLSSGKESYRVPLTKFAGNQFDTAGNIEKITNPFLRETIRDHFENTHKKSSTEAFGAEGILGLNKRLAERTILKNGKVIAKPHPPINSVKVYRKKLKDGKKHEITLQKLDREKSYNNNLYVNTGSNYLFAVLQKDDGSRDYDIISLFEAVELLKDSFNSASDKEAFDKDKMFKEYFEHRNKAQLLFTLKQYDMVYFPDEEEEVLTTFPKFQTLEKWKNPDRLKNIYTVTKFSGKQIYFQNHSMAEVIEKKVELGSQNMLEFYQGRKIIEYSIPIVLDRLGNIIPEGFQHPHVLVNKT